jgi:hypothetical protein
MSVCRNDCCDRGCGQLIPLGSSSACEDGVEHNFDSLRLSAVLVGHSELRCGSIREQLGQKMRSFMRSSDSSFSQRPQARSLQVSNSPLDQAWGIKFSDIKEPNPLQKCPWSQSIRSFSISVKSFAYFWIEKAVLTSISSSVLVCSKSLSYKALSMGDRSKLTDSYVAVKSDWFSVVLRKQIDRSNRRRFRHGSSS